MQVRANIAPRMEVSVNSRERLVTALERHGAERLTVDDERWSFADLAAALDDPDYGTDDGEDER